MRRLVFALALFSTTTAYAQETGRVGITMGYPASIGIIWHVSDRVAVRPELSWSETSSESTSSLTFSSQGTTTVTTTRTSSDGYTVGVGASGLLYVRKSEGLSMYVSPRVAYTRTSNTTTPGSPLAASSSAKFTTSGYLASGSFGAQYALGRRFGVFGEVGLAYSHSTNSNSLSIVGGNNTAGSISTRSGAGVVLYF
jgi:hypothetical protein